MIAQHEIAQPKRQAVNENGSAIALISGNLIGNIQRAIDRLPARTTIGLVPSNPISHFHIESLRSRYVNQVTVNIFSEALCKAAFS